MQAFPLLSQQVLGFFFFLVCLFMEGDLPTENPRSFEPVSKLQGYSGRCVCVCVRKHKRTQVHVCMQICIFIRIYLFYKVLI